MYILFQKLSANKCDILKYVVFYISHMVNILQMSISTFFCLNTLNCFQRIFNLFQYFPNEKDHGNF